MEINTIVYFDLPDGAVEERKLNIIPREGDVVEFGEKEYVVKYVRHTISEFIPDRFKPTNRIEPAVTTHLITIILKYS